MVLSFFPPQFYLGLGFEVIISVAFTNAEKPAFDVLLFSCLWNRYNDFEENYEGYNVIWIHFI